MEHSNSKMVTAIRKATQELEMALNKGLGAPELRSYHSYKKPGAVLSMVVVHL